MTKRMAPLPRAPWHAPVSRRAGRVSPGLPTLIVCVLGLLPFAVQAGHSVATGRPMAAATIDAPPPAKDPATVPAPVPAAAPVTDTMVALDGDGDRRGRGERGDGGRRGGGGSR